MLRFLAIIGVAAFAAASALAEPCDQALKDTTAASKSAVIGPKAGATVAELLKNAEPLCKGEGQQQAEGIEMLRIARAMIGE